ncbi:hypothetical protein ACF3DV_16015 [Chlorogloeopsis fritschii PCC 9212]|uniref:Uncharacterized protein n=1 Tax=Chlorogloeopsis fritschii PCC 6912 TaxID=211165 RepID=A0A433NKK0_CHLFR|nr:hypothetical protein [Chlorogloeopsis fritschii]RUR83319.1 hypothetical protein PCC6912_21520 [Chlorogloeopsis fritschii PCC 6912]
MTDILPATCYLINYYLGNKFIKQCNKGFRSGYIFSIILIFSVYTQTVGAFGSSPGRDWDSIPIPTNHAAYEYRFWELKDTQIARHTNALFHKIIKPPIDNEFYVQGLSGVIKQVLDEKNQPINSLISVGIGSEKIFKAELENTGVSRWFGYESALKKGEVRVRCQFFDKNNQLVKEVRLYVSGTPKQYETTNAIASILSPDEPGTYKLIFDLIAEGVNEFPKNSDVEYSFITVIVEDNRQFAQEIQIMEPFKSGKSGETVKIPLIVKNTSNFVWKNAGTNPVNLSYHWLDDNGKVIVFDGERTPLPGSLPVRGLIKLNATLKLPDNPGKYTLVLTMVKEYVAWFNDKNAKPLEIPVEIISR